MHSNLIYSGLTVLVLLLASGCAQSNKTACNQFKTGTFQYRSNGLDYTISREDTVQIEVNKLNGDITKTSVNWIADCTYELKPLESTVTYPDSINQLRMASTLTVEILSWTDRYYIYKSQSNVADRVVTDTLWISSH
jgi:hypothetical protein